VRRTHEEKKSSMMIPYNNEPKENLLILPGGSITARYFF